MKFALAFLLSAIALASASPYGSYGQTERPQLVKNLPKMELNQGYGGQKIELPKITFKRPTLEVSSGYGQQRPQIVRPQMEVSSGYGQQRPQIVRPQIVRPQFQASGYGQEKPQMVRPQLEVQSTYGEQKIQVFPTQPAVFPTKPQMEIIETPVQSSYGQQEIVRPKLEVPSYGQQEIIRPKLEVPSYGQQEIVRPKMFPTEQQTSYGGYGAQLPGAFESSICVGKVAGTKLPNPSNENQYWVCLEDGEFQLMECPNFLVFHAESEQCENTARNLPGCASNPCQNGGICNELAFKKTFCQCQPGFSGDFCDKTDACAVSSCGYDGICIAQPAGSPVDKLCIWDRGQKYGINYNTAEVNPCLSNENLKTYPSNLGTSVYIHCEGSIPHLKFCALSSFYNHFVGRCEWSTENPSVLPNLSFEQQTSYGSGY